MAESQTLAYCLKALALAKIYHWRNNTGSFAAGSRYIECGLKGSADILGLLPDGRFLAIECKSERGLLSEAQKLFRSKIQGNNGVYVVIRAPREMIHFLMEHGFSEAATQLLQLSNIYRRRQRSRGIAPD